MLKKLRRRLTVIFTALTGSILAAVIGVSLWFSLAQAKQNAMDQFINNLSFIGSNLPSSSQNAAWLTDTEKTNQYIIKGTRNAKDISFTPGWGTTEQRELLTGQAIDLLGNSRVATITLTGDGLAEAFMVGNMVTIYTDSAIIEYNPAIFFQ